MLVNFDTMSNYTAQAFKFLIILLVLGVGAANAASENGNNSPFLAPIIPYNYPFADVETAQQLNAKPMVVELFTSLDCLFCPRAEALVTDLAAKTRAITLVYHTDPEGPAYPLSRSFGVDRQAKYAAILSDGLLYTPQIVLNGHVDAVGHEFDDVARGLRLGFKDTLLPLALRPVTGQAGLYRIDLPAVDVGAGGADVLMVTYRPPVMIPKTMRQSMTHPDPLARVVKNVVPLGGWDGRAKTVTATFVPDADVAGFVILAQKSDGVILGAVAGP